MDLRLQLCSKEDTGKIAELAQLIWNQHYRSIISDEQIKYMLSNMYNHTSLLQQMQEKKHLFYFVVAGSEITGFLSVNEISEGYWFLNKFYIDQTKAAKGIGTAAFEAVLKLHTIKKIELTVNRQNYKAINFYFKNGFKIKEVADFDIGNGYFMNDFVMLHTTD
jgi:RimJ/RimL family protein N-acetyltransferase